MADNTTRSLPGDPGQYAGKFGIESGTIRLPRQSNPNFIDVKARYVDRDKNEVSKLPESNRIRVVKQGKKGIH